MNPLVAKMNLQKKKSQKNFEMYIYFIPLAVIMTAKSKKLFERYGVKQPFAVIISLSRKIMSKSFLKKFFETYQKLNSFTVMMTIENKLKNFLKLPIIWDVSLL